MRREQRQLLSAEVRQQLADEITNGTYAPDEKLPSEPEFAKRYGISRPTLREILSGLERDGLIRRVHGVGTFVTPKRTRVHSVLDLDIGVTEAVTAAKANLNVEVMEARVGPIRAWITAALELPEDAEALRVERIIRVDGVPATHGFDVFLSIFSRQRAPPPTTADRSISSWKADAASTLSAASPRSHRCLPPPAWPKCCTAHATAPYCASSRQNGPQAAFQSLMSQEHYAPASSASQCTASAATAQM